MLNEATLDKMQAMKMADMALGYEELLLGVHTSPKERCRCSQAALARTRHAL